MLELYAPDPTEINYIIIYVLLDIIDSDSFNWILLIGGLLKCVQIWQSLANASYAYC